MSTGRKLVVGIILLAIFISTVITGLLTRDMRLLSSKTQTALGTFIQEVGITPADAKTKPEYPTLGDRVTQITTQAGQEQVESVALEIANRIKGQMDVHFGKTKAIADLLIAYKMFCEKNEEEPNRDLVMSLLRGSLLLDENMQAIWVGWEPDQFDGNDAAFVGKEIIDEGSILEHVDDFVSTGLFYPWFYKEDGKILQSILDDYKDPGSEYYLGAFESGKEYITEPYSDGTVQMSSFAAPLYFKDKLVGVVGTDVRMGDLIEMIEASKPLETGTAMLISADGKFVAHPYRPWMTEDEEKDTHKPLISEVPGLEATAKNLLSEKTTVYTSKTILGPGHDTEMQVIQIPVQFGSFPKKWTVVVAVPFSQVMKSRDEAGAAINDVLGKMRTTRDETRDDASQSMTRAYVVGVAVLVVALIVGVLFAGNVNNVVAARDYWYRQMLDTVHAPISVVDRNKKITFVNKIAQEYLKKTEAACLGQSHASVWGSELDSALELLEKNQGNVTKQHFASLSWEVCSDFILERNGRKSGMIEFFKDVTDRDNILQLAEGVEKVIENAVAKMAEITADSARLSAGSEEQAASLQEVTANMNQMSEQTKQNAANAKTANELTNEAVQAANKGQVRMNEMIESMNQINANAQDTQRVIKTIDNIAFQTNLLALNAAVEAARAGTHGKGFAVVAEEVRNLASRSAKAAQETEELIKKSNSQIDAGVQTAHQTASALNAISDQVTKAMELVSNIAESSREQASGVERIDVTLKQVEVVTQQNSQTAVATATVANELNEEINELSQMMANFK